MDPLGAPWAGAAAPAAPVGVGEDDVARSGGPGAGDPSDNGDGVRSICSYCPQSPPPPAPPPLVASWWAPTWAPASESAAPVASAGAAAAAAAAAAATLADSIAASSASTWAIAALAACARAVAVALAAAAAATASIAAAVLAWPGSQQRAGGVSDEKEKATAAVGVVLGWLIFGAKGKKKGCARAHTHHRHQGIHNPANAKEAAELIWTHEVIRTVGLQRSFGSKHTEHYIIYVRPCFIRSTKKKSHGLSRRQQSVEAGMRAAAHASSACARNNRTLRCIHTPYIHITDVKGDTETKIERVVRLTTDKRERTATMTNDAHKK